jgi:uncharacterized SAM-dependent methyltransferase
MALKPEIIDVRIRQNGQGLAGLGKQVVDGLLRPSGCRNLPTQLLYDTRGLHLYDDITTLVPEYYLFGAEEEILKSHADDIVQVMHARWGGGVLPGEVVLELGAG